MRGAFQSIAFLLILAVGLGADGLMESLGPGGFIKAAGTVIIIAGLLIWLSDRPGRKRKPSAGDSSSNGRRHQRKR